MKKLAILSSLLLLVMNSCSNEEIFNGDLSVNLEKRISVVAEDLTPANGTRTTYTEGENGYHFAWTEGDALGIFPESGNQTVFPISNGYGTNTAFFDGGKWALRPNESYAAYFPLEDKVSLDYTSIPVDYTGQVQDGNGSTAHLGKYDYMASEFSEVDANGNVKFALKHLGCLVQFKFTMPKADTYSALEIESNNTPFITSGTYSLSDANHSLENLQTSNKITIGLTNVSTTAEDKTLTITAMFAPVDLTGSQLSMTLKGTNRSYKFNFDGCDMTQGKAIGISSMSAPGDIPYITFQADWDQTLSLSKAVETLEYSVNNGPWSALGTSSVEFGGTKGTLRLRGKSAIGTGVDYNNHAQVIFNTSSEVRCSGDLRTLVDYENYLDADCSNAKFYGLFMACSALISAPEMPAEDLAEGCYNYMYYLCTSLTNIPEVLPATTLTENCYNYMFSGCSHLTRTPVLPAKTLANYCYEGMFNKCIDLTQVSELPATILKRGCYTNMFSECSRLVDAPSLPATSLEISCYESMFRGCTSLVNGPEELPAETLVDNCYSRMFFGCSSLTNVPEILATTITGQYCCSEMFEDCKALLAPPSVLAPTTLKSMCYWKMFMGCINLKNTPELPATDLASSCYESMFEGCTSLKQVSSLPAESLVSSCYNSMFKGCTSLENAPILPASNLAYQCYMNMFSGCTSLTTAPALNATSLAQKCYSSMFYNCTSLVSIPTTLPATTLETSCYSSMFGNCKKIVSAPVLPATTLVGQCYFSMFSGCENLSYIKMLATDISATNCTEYWVNRVPTSGIFVKNASATWSKSGMSGVPSGWTVKAE